jgi:Tfp pilus assembly protein PilF
MIHSVVALRSGDADKAVEALAAAAPYKAALYATYLLGEAYLADRQGAAAASQFQKILEHPGAVVNDPIGALAHLGLGRAYALAGDNAKAKTAYQDFFALWKNADPDVPILQQAKVEYAKLK